MTDFILTNEDRDYLGLSPIQADWSVMKIKHVTLYFEGNWIKKMVRHSEFSSQDFSYFECDVLVETTDDKSLVLPKTKRGKPKKLNYTATTTFHPIGVYLRYEEGRLTIGNFTTQKTFFYEWLTQEKPYKKAFDTWLLAWKKETTEADLKALELFKTEARKKQRYKEGDIFYFKHDRRRYGFGKIVIDITKRRKDPSFMEKKHYGLTNLMGPPLVVKIYHKLQDSPEIDLDELEMLSSFPLQPIMDNHIYYGEYPIISNRPVTPKDLDEAILSVSSSITHSNTGIAYLQYGLIYREIPKEVYHHHATEKWLDYRNEGIGFSLFLDNFEACIKAGSNQAYYEANPEDLRNPINQADKKAIFSLFGLDAGLDYEGNLKHLEKKDSL